MTTPPFFFELDFRSAFLANMTSRISTTINEDFSRLLKERSIVTPVTDVSLLLFIAKNENTSIAEIARGLTHSHQRTASRISALEKLNLIVRRADTTDTRCQRFRLSERGKQDIGSLSDIFDATSRVIDELMANQGVDLMKELLVFYTALEGVPLSHRVSQILNSN